MAFVEISPAGRGRRPVGPVRYRCAGKGIHFIFSPDIARDVGLFVGGRARVSLGVGMDAGKISIVPALASDPASYAVLKKRGADTLIAMGLSRLGLPSNLKIGTAAAEYHLSPGRRQIIITLPMLAKSEAA